MLEMERLATLDYSSRGVEWSLSLLGCIRGWGGETWVYIGYRVFVWCSFVLLFWRVKGILVYYIMSNPSQVNRYVQWVRNYIFIMEPQRVAKSKTSNG